jgi:hypothetical protein
MIRYVIGAAVGAVLTILLGGLIALAFTFGRSSSTSSESMLGGAAAPAIPMAPGLAHFAQEAAPVEEKALDAMPSEMPRAKRASKSGGLMSALGGGSASLRAGAMKEGAGAGGLAAKPAPEPGSDGEGALPTATRAWFPETFLFQPLVVTDEKGSAVVPVKVPDRLTSWRVLALAHSREGSQAGAVASFLGTLPVYVDPVLPPFLMAGDEVRLPIQVVNTTEGDLARTLSVDGVGASVKFNAAPLKIPAGGSVVAYAALKAERPGLAGLRASLAGSDAVEKTFPVNPLGMPVEKRFGGTLASPRTVDIEGPAELEKDSAQVRVAVYPGALAVLRSELSGSLSRGGVEDDAYTLHLAGKAPELLKALGEEADPDAVRTLSIVAGQRVIRHALAPTVSSATLMAEAALAHPGNPVLARIGERLATKVASAQRPDGTFEGATGWTLQRLLVTTADGLRAVRAATGDASGRQRAAGAALRASGAFERTLEQVRDGYTAAAILSSGALKGPLAEKLRARVREAVTQDSSGYRALSVEPSVVRPDGRPPTGVEATALAALALEGDDQAPWRADLGATLLAAYHPAYGWGDGKTNLVALRAVLSLFKDKVPSQVKIALTIDGRPAADGVLDASKSKDVLVLAAAVPDAAGTHTYGIRADPPVAGLGYALTLTGFVPWKKERANRGLELALTEPKDATVGQASEVLLEAAAPSGKPLKVRHALPAGVQPDLKSLASLVSAGTLTRFRAMDGAVEMEVPARQPGEVFAAKYRVVPTLAGTLRSGASTIALLADEETAHHVPPAVWSIR